MFFQLLAEIATFNRLSDISLNFIGKAIKWLINLGGNVGVGIILFTVALKLITLPLDIYSRVTMRKSSLKMEKMRPQLEKLKVQYADNKNLYSQKMMELYKKEGYSMFSACLPTIVTLVFFILVLNAFQAYSRYATLNTFNDMCDSYTAVVETYLGEGNNKITQEVLDKYGFTTQAQAEETIIEQARQASAQTYKDANIKFLWVKNIWIADNATAKPILKHSEFVKKIGNLPNSESFTSSAYEEITYNLQAEKTQPNGYFILIALAVGVIILSQLVMMKSQKAQMELQSVDGQGAQTQKMMMYMMPVMIGIFAFMYTSAFCIYMVVNSALTIISTLVINKSVDYSIKRKDHKEEMERLNDRYNKIKSAQKRK